MTALALSWEVGRVMGDADSDEALLARFQLGERAAFEALFRRFAPALTSYLTRVTGSAAAAEDAVQLTFLSVVRSSDQFRVGSRVKPWLYAIATNAARDRHRRTRHEASGADDAVEAGLDAVLGDVGLRRRLLAALQQLPAPQREAVVLHRLEGWSFAEIAEVVGANEVAVKLRAFRGTQTLRTLLKDVWEFES